MTKTANQSKCRLGFACSTMLQQPKLRADRCPNRATCRDVVTFESDERGTFLRVRCENNSLIEEYIQLSRDEAAVLMLKDRGCSQSLDDFGLLPSIESIMNLLGDLRSQIESYREHYIAPDGCEAHTYKVKANVVKLFPDAQGELVPTHTKVPYTYYKLAATRPLFVPAIEPKNVKVLHLSRRDDPRSQEGRRGIERRNRLKMLRTQLRDIENALSHTTAWMKSALEIGDLQQEQEQ